MLEITRLTVEHLAQGCVTDCPAPRIGFAVQSDRNDAELTDAILQVGDWNVHLPQDGQTGTAYKGPALLPFTTYGVRLTVTDNTGAAAEAETTFETGRMETPWRGQWISDQAFTFTEAKVSPVPMVFRKTIETAKPIARARLYATAMGIYEVELNGQKLGQQYFAPGFTSYKSYLQYQTYDVTKLLTGRDTLTATVAGGWAVGSFVFTRKNRVTADRQALLAELRIEYADGNVEVIGTDSSWEVTENGPVRMADLYDGETYDATHKTDGWHAAAPEPLKITPAITAEYGVPVTAHEVFKAVAVTTAPDGETIYGRYPHIAAGQCRSGHYGAPRRDIEPGRHTEHDLPAQCQGHRSLHLSGRSADLQPAFHLYGLPLCGNQGCKAGGCRGGGGCPLLRCGTRRSLPLLKRAAQPAAVQHYMERKVQFC